MMNKVVDIKSQLLNFQKSILRDIEPYVIQNHTFLDVENWFNASSNIHLYTQKEKLYISSENATRDYLSFLERNNSYGILPKHELLALPDERIEINLEGQLLGDIEVTFMLVEYSQNEKLKVHNIYLNKKTVIKTAPTARYFRLAIRVSKTGVCAIEKFNFRRLNDIQISYIGTPTQKSVKKRNIERLKDLKVACIFDEFTRTCYEKEVDLISFTPENWQSVLTENRPDILMVESAWRGNYGTWEYKVASYNNQNQDCLFDLIKWCKDRDIPTVFWNKEDPIHFNKFISTAKYFDYVFTTDQNMVGNYQKMVGHQNVFVLPFSAEPKLHNPIKLYENREDKICFAGSYYANRHADRKKDMDDVLDICAEFGLDIFDRNYERNKLGGTDFMFPERFHNNIKGSLKYDEINKAYKGYKVMLNVNSVKQSPTMFSRRIFEGLACGTPIVSSYSEGIKKIFKDIVLISENQEVLRDNLEKLMSDESFYREKSLYGIREVFLNHTYQNRIKFILDKVGINYQINHPKVTVIGIAHSQNEFDELVENFNKQTWSEKELVIFVDTFEGYTELINKFNTESIKTYVLPYMNNYSRLDELISTEFIAYFSLSDFYGENYLLDLMLASIYTDADIIGKRNYYSYTGNRKKVINEKNPSEEYEFVSELATDSSVLKTCIFSGEELNEVMEGLINKKSLNKYFKKGFRLFAADKYNYMKLGRNASTKEKNKLEL